jgi:hypothetical protein
VIVVAAHFPLLYPCLDYEEGLRCRSLSILIAFGLKRQDARSGSI